MRLTWKPSDAHQGLVGAPGAVDATVQEGLVRSCVFQSTVDDTLDVLDLVAVGYQHRVGGFHHHQVLDTGGGHQP